MNPLVLSLPEIKSEDRLRVGGKGFTLAAMAQGGLQVPPALCITPEAYLEFVATHGDPGNDPPGTGPKILRGHALGGDMGYLPAHP